MSQHLRRDINQLKKQVLYYCTLVEENLTMAVTSLDRNDEELAKQVLEKEKDIDKHEIEIEEECLKILALYQPVAIDLRFIVAVLKINNDLERIGDMAAHIVERFLCVDCRMGKAHFPHLTQTAGKVREILRLSLDSLVNLDVKLARKINPMDEKIDESHGQFFNLMEKTIQNDPGNTTTWLNLLFISKQLERISDHATNIAEDVIYLVNGEIVRHAH